MRGKENMKQMCNFFSRITPAYAGKSEFPFSISVPIPGSPPPMRGKVSILLLYAKRV